MNIGEVDLRAADPQYSAICHHQSPNELAICVLQFFVESKSF
jgi:hypothetical protein